MKGSPDLLGDPLGKLLGEISVASEANVPVIDIAMIYGVVIFIFVRLIMRRETSTEEWKIARSREK